MGISKYAMWTAQVTGAYSRQLLGVIADHENVKIQSMDIRFEDSGSGTGKTDELETDAAITKRKLSVSGSVANRYSKERDTSAPFNLRLSIVAPCDVSDVRPIKENLIVSVTAHYQDANAGGRKAGHWWTILHCLESTPLTILWIPCWMG